MTTTLRALTVRHPWALAIALGIKDVENRDAPAVAGSARNLAGQRIAIHASKAVPTVPTSQIVGTLAAVQMARALCGNTEEEQLRTAGHIIATAVIDRVIFTSDGDPLNRSPWRTADRFAIVLRDVVRLREPVEAKGALGFWRVPEDVAARIEAPAGR
jgi:hypothetical protein